MEKCQNCEYYKICQGQFIDDCPQDKIPDGDINELLDQLKWAIEDLTRIKN